MFVMKKAEIKTPQSAPETPGDAPAAPEPLVPVEPTPLTQSQLEELQARAAKADETWERLVRATADFENFKKRATRERQDAARFANESLVQKLIPVLDNFEMALGASQTAEGGGQKSDLRPPTSDLRALTAGVAMIQQQLKAVLTDAGVVEVDATGQPFDPHQHEAVSQQESAEVPEGHILQQLRKGYKIRERLLRPATVIVAKKPTTPVVA